MFDLVHTEAIVVSRSNYGMVMACLPSSLLLEDPETIVGTILVINQPQVGGYHVRPNNRRRQSYVQFSMPNRSLETRGIQFVNFLLAAEVFEEEYQLVDGRSKLNDIKFVKVQQKLSVFPIEHPDADDDEL